MVDREIKISFADAAPGDASRLAQELEQDLRSATRDVNIALEQARQDSQDFGSTLVLLFGTPVAIALARAITTFLHRNSGASITITENGAVIGKNLDSKDAARIAEAFGTKKK